MTSKYEMNMTKGPLFSKLVVFTLPIILSNALHILYSAADVIVVGQFAGSTALAAVSSTTSLISLVVNLFIGLSTGTGIVVARCFGAGDTCGVHETVHTAVLTAVMGGCAVGLFGFLLARTFLTWMGSPADVIGQATLYLRIYFLGTPVSMLYNFGAAILHAIGDTRRPLGFLTLSGILNVVLNLVFVVGFHMDVVGVAVATVLSQLVSAVCVTGSLLRAHGASYQLRITELRLYRSRFLHMAKAGIPAGIQSSLFAISNVLLQSSVNGFGSLAMAGVGAAQNIENIAYTAKTAFHTTAQTFTSQNLGALRMDRIQRVLRYCLALVTGLCLSIGLVCLLFAEPLLSIYNDDPAVIAFGVQRLSVTCCTLFINGIMDVLCGQLRGIGSSVIPMATSILGICGMRILWIYGVFPAFPTLACLYLSYPVSWTITAAAQFFCYLLVFRRLKRRFAEDIR